MLRRVLIMGVVLALLLFGSGGATLAAGAQPDVHARAALLIDGQTGQVLYSLNAGARMYPASITKVLTALVAIERGQLGQEITVSTKAVNQPWDATLAGLRQGEKLTLGELLHGLLLPSGNDAAVAIAEGVAGSEAAFAALMNQRAAQLGATHSHFVNASGLHDPQHYTTASDMALIARAAFNNPVLVRIAQTETYMLPGNRKIENHDGLLGYYGGIVAGKTGFTEQAGKTIVALARRGQLDLVGVVLNSQLSYTDVMSILDYGFKGFKRVVAVRAGEPAGSVAITGGAAPGVVAVTSREFSYDVPNGEQPVITTQALLYPDVRAPVAAGQKIGEIWVRLNGAEVATVDLLANAAVPLQAPIVALASKAWQMPSNLGWWKWAAAGSLLVGVAGARLVYTAQRRRRRRYRRLGTRQPVNTWRPPQA